jgi:hypothetical protein
MGTSLETIIKNGKVKNRFGLSVFYFQFLECILQVLQTPIKKFFKGHPILTKLDLLHSIYSTTKETTVIGIYLKEKSESVHDLDSLFAITNNDH